MNGKDAKSDLLILVFIFLLFFKGYSIGDQSQVGAREVALGNAAVAIISPFSVFHNQGAIARINHFCVAVDYRQPYLIEGFAEKALAVIVPASVSNFGFCLQQKGIQGYHETRFGLALAKPFGKRVSAGMQFNYFLVDFPEQGRSRSAFLIDFGMLFMTSNSLTLGFHVFNPSGATIESLNLKSDLPVCATTGFVLKPSANLLFASAVTWYKESPFVVMMGIEYQFADCFFIRGGLSGRPFRHSAGLGYTHRWFTIDIAFNHHETLGYTPSLSLALSFKK